MTKLIPLIFLVSKLLLTMVTCLTEGQPYERRILQSSSSSNNSFVPLTPSINESNFTITLSSSQQASVNSWISWVESLDRYDIGSTTYAPENPSYIGSTEFTTIGIAIYTTATFCLLYFLTFMCMRLFCGYCGGYKSKKRSLTRAYKHTPTAIFIIGIILYLIGTIMNLAGHYSFSNHVDNSVSSLLANGQSYGTTFSSITSTLSTLNNTFEYANSSNTTTYFQIGDNPNVDTNISNAISLNIVGSTNLALELDSKVTQSGILMWIFFTFGLLSSICGVFIYIKKIAAFSFALGAFNGFLVFFAWLMIGLSFSVLVYNADFCTQIDSLATEGIIPPYGTGVSYYVNCFSSNIQQNLGSENYYALSALNNSLYIFQNLILNFTNNATLANSLTTLESCVNLISQAPYNNTIDLTTWVNGLMIPLNTTLTNIMDLQNCRYLLQFATSTDVEICAYGLNDLKISIIGYILLSFAFMFFSFGGIMSRNVFIRLKEQRETMISRAELAD